MFRGIVPWQQHCVFLSVHFFHSWLPQWLPTWRFYQNRKANQRDTNNFLSIHFLWRSRRRRDKDSMTSLSFHIFMCLCFIYSRHAFDFHAVSQSATLSVDKQTKSEQNGLLFGFLDDDDDNDDLILSLLTPALLCFSFHFLLMSKWNSIHEITSYQVMVFPCQARAKGKDDRRYPFKNNKMIFSWSEINVRLKICFKDRSIVHCLSLSLSL